jgi:regulator of sigma E protease
VSWNAVLPGVLLLGLVIFVHELGHFLMAKWRGVRVLRFSLGFGPKLWGFTRGETEYCIAWFPLGGYVQMAGDSVEEDGHMPGSHDEFLSHPWFGRFLIAIAGPAANLVTAFVVLVAVGMIGVSYPDYPNRLGATPDTSVAHRHGLREGDAIVQVAGRPARSWVEIFILHSDTDRAKGVEVVAEREGRRFPVTLTAEEREPFFSSLRRPPDPPVVGAVVTGMPAYKAGFREGDRIVAVDGAPIATWDDLPRALVDKVDRDVTIRVRRGNSEFDIAVTPMDPEGRGSRIGRIGVEPPRHGTFVERHGLIESLGMGTRATAALVGSVYSGMWLTLSRPLYYREYVGGPLFIAQAASQQARRGIDAYLQFLAMINIAIMAFNLLPLPMLDGGHMLLAAVEALRRRGLSARTYVRFQKAGLVVLGALLVLILANDPLRMIQRQRAIDRHTSTYETAPRTTAPEERPVVPARP